ncbi:hypothetical protein TIFTF001_025312 [Ficus carica]|uniref:Uncharacterized protein n=1 Tax=Ficus carica TaxID=3494 RepID=A0AA88DKJ2_FICCA|nr:hypothetical protein TIFTF001_025312 [Ficus carica]
MAVCNRPDQIKPVKNPSSGTGLNDHHLWCTAFPFADHELITFGARDTILGNTSRTITHTAPTAQRSLAPDTLPATRPVLAPALAPDASLRRLVRLTQYPPPVSVLACLRVPYHQTVGTRDASLLDVRCMCT